MAKTLCFFRYLAKRAAYVDAIDAQLKEALASALLEGSWQWAQLCKGRLRVESEVIPWRYDGVKPLISLRFLGARGTASAGCVEDSKLDKATDRALRQLLLWEIRLFPSCSPNVFKEKLLGPQANAVRRRTTASRNANGSSTTAETILTAAEVRMLPPTPYYNGLVLEDTR